MHDNHAETESLLTAIRGGVYLFSIVLYDKEPQIDTLVDTIQTTFPNKNVRTFDASKADGGFVQQLLDESNSIVIIRNFMALFEENNNSTRIGFNQRRDKFTQLRIQIIACVPDNPWNVPAIQKGIPDTYSVLFPLISLRDKVEFYLLRKDISGSSRIDIADFLTNIAFSAIVR